MLIQQLLVNLLENALKYTPAESPIEIRARAQPGGVEIVVADRGPGIPAGEEQRIFDKFYRVGGARGGGVGLGLAICKGIVMAHGGQIFVDEPRWGRRRVSRLPASRWRATCARSPRPGRGNVSAVGASPH